MKKRLFGTGIFISCGRPNGVAVPAKDLEPQRMMAFRPSRKGLGSVPGMQDTLWVCTNGCCFITLKKEDRKLKEGVEKHRTKRGKTKKKPRKTIINIEKRTMGKKKTLKHPRLFRYFSARTWL